MTGVARSIWATVAVAAVAGAVASVALGAGGSDARTSGSGLTRGVATNFSGPMDGIVYAQQRSGRRPRVTISLHGISNEVKAFKLGFASTRCGAAGNPRSEVFLPSGVVDNLDVFQIVAGPRRLNLTRARSVRFYGTDTSGTSKQESCSNWS